MQHKQHNNLNQQAMGITQMMQDHVQDKQHMNGQNGHNHMQVAGMTGGPNNMRPALNKNESKKSGGRKPTPSGEKKTN